MSISVVIHSNQTDVELLERALYSVINQTVAADEIIVVEGVSRPDMYALRAMIERARRYIMERNLDNALLQMPMMKVSYLDIKMLREFNVSSSRNLGLINSDSKFVCFLDGDDEWYPDVLASYLPLMTGDVCLVTAPYYVERDDGEFELFQPRVPKGYELYGENLIGDTSFVMVRRSVFHKVHGFDLRIPYRAEWDLWIRMLKHGTVAIADCIAGIKYDGPQSASRSADCRRGWISFIYKYRDILYHHPEQGDRIREQFAKAMERIGERPYMTKGPTGLIYKHVARILPWWLNIKRVIPEDKNGPPTFFDDFEAYRTYCRLPGGKTLLRWFDIRGLKYH